MIYSIGPIVAIFVNFIINFDVMFRRNKVDRIPAIHAYRLFLLSISIYFIADTLWGIFDLLNWFVPNFIITVIYFLAMSFSVYMWTHYVVSYLNKKTIFSTILKFVGRGFLLAGIVILIVNFFHPIMFEFVDGEYNAHTARYSFLFAQLLMFVLTSAYVFVLSFVREKGAKEKYIAIGFFGLIMAIAMIFQIIYPDYPVYSLGYILGLVEMHTFVVSGEKKEYQTALDERVLLEQKQQEEIVATKELAYTDSLTGVKSKHAYVELEENIDRLIATGQMNHFSLIVFDLNDLKLINDKLGHVAGDNYIINAVKTIQAYFPNSTLYRFGGDEFIAFIEEKDYENRHDVLNLFNKKIEENFATGEPIIATGLSDYIPGKDNTFRAVFSRADERMYIRKRQLKKRGAINLSKVQTEHELDDDANEDRLEKLKAELIRIREESAKESNPRIGFYKTFYRNEEYPLIDLLNNSSCDEIMEINLNDNTFKQLYHVDGKYFVPTVDIAYSDLFDFVSRYIVHPDDREIYDKFMEKEGLLDRLKNSEIPNFLFEQFRYKLQDGDYRYVEQCAITGEENGIAPGIVRLYIFDIHNYKLRQNGIVGNEKDLISKGRDSVTNLLLEKEFLLKAQDLIEANSNLKWCLISIDIEHFRFFDEWFGRESGDLLLAKIGALLSEWKSKVNSVSGYFGKDDFALVMPYQEEQINELYEKMRDIILSFGMTAGFLPAFGIALLEKDLALIDAFDRATIASSKAKADIRDRICVYNDEMQFLAQKEYRLLSDFMHALKNNEITFYLQPQCRISSGKVVGVEALARWIKKDGTIVSPGEFVPVLEKYGFIPDLDLYIWERVCLFLHDWLEKGNKAVPCSINVSRADLFSMDIANTLLELTNKYQIPHKLLKIEITESSYVEAMELVDQLVETLMKEGFSVLMDDFGSGYSSLNMLSNLKLDAIKLDARFLQIGSGENAKALHILESVVNMAKTIGLPIIVEGVENKNQADFLEDLGCRYIQGFYFYKPMPIDDFRDLIRDETMIDGRGFVAKLNEQMRIREFLDKNIYSDSMLNNILGSVAFYSWKGEETDIVRFNEQFYKSVDVSDFNDRLKHIERWMPKEDVQKLHDVLKLAMENKLNGAVETLRFYKPDGTLSSYSVHFYYLGKKEGGERFYGSTEDVTELNDLREEIKLIANYSKDSLVFLSRVDNKWIYSVASRGLADVFDISPAELEKELNNGDFAKKRVVNRKKFDMMHQSLEEYSLRKISFESNFDVYDSSHHIVALHVSYMCVGDLTNNIEYIVNASPIY